MNTEYQGHAVEGTVYYPACQPRLADLPVVVFSTGWNQPRISYQSYGTQLAQWGYIAVVRQYPSIGIFDPERAMFDEHVEQTVGILDWCARENGRPDSPLYGMADTDNVGMTGHSLGAGVALRTTLADDRVRATVSLDVTYSGRNFNEPDTLQDTSAAVMYIASAEGGWCGTPVLEPVDHLFEYSPAPACEITIAGADHIDFIDRLYVFSHMANIFCPRGTAKDEDVRDIARRYMTAWFNVHLKGLDAFSAYYDGHFSEEDIEQGLVTVRVKHN